MIFIPGIFKYNVILWIMAGVLIIIPMMLYAEGHVALQVALILPVIVVLELFGVTVVIATRSKLYVFKIPLPFLSIVKYLDIREIRHIESGFTIIKPRTESNTDLPIKFRYVHICALPGHRLKLMRLGMGRWYVRHCGRRLASMLNVEFIEDQKNEI